MNKYQSLVAWKRAHALVLLGLRVTDDAYHPRARPLFDQIRRAVVSVEANLVEGYALGSPRQFPSNPTPRSPLPEFQYHLEMTTFLSVKNCTLSCPCALRSPKNDPFVPPKGKNAIGAATPILIPIIDTPQR